jgi:hypothetical protein
MPLVLNTHPYASHVGYGSERVHGRLYLHFICRRCGDRTRMPCSGYEGQPARHLANYVRAHTVCGGDQTRRWQR